MKCYLNIVNIENNFFSDYIEKIHITGIEGDLDIYAGHTALLTMIKEGPLCIFQENKIEKYFYISNGILEIQPNNINILSDILICGIDLNFNKLIELKKKIQISLINCKNNELNILKKKIITIESKLKVISLMNLNK